MFLVTKIVWTKAADLNLFINGVLIEQVTHVKLLGVMLDNTLSWSKHIDYIVSTMGKGIAVARKCSAFIPSSLLKDVVQSLVLSHLEYCPRKLSWLPVKVKLHLRLLVYFYKVFKFHTPCFFFEKLVYVGLRHDYKTRQVSKDQLFLPYPRTNLMKKTVLIKVLLLGIWFP